MYISISVLRFIYSPQFLLALSLFSTSLALFMFCYKLICTFFRIYIYVVSFTIIFLFLSYFTQHNNLEVHLYFCKWHSFLRFYGWVIIHYIYIYIYIYTRACTHTHTHTHHIFFIWSSADGHLGCFHVLAIVNSAAMNTGLHVSFSNYSFL